jgi:hypothetical protein
MLICVAELRVIYWYLTGPLIMLSRADVVTSLMFIKRLLDQTSRDLKFDRRHKGSVPVVGINNC